MQKDLGFSQVIYLCFPAGEHIVVNNVIVLEWHGHLEQIENLADMLQHLERLFPIPLQVLIRNSVISGDSRQLNVLNLKTEQLDGLEFQPLINFLPRCGPLVICHMSVGKRYNTSRQHRSHRATRSRHVYCSVLFNVVGICLYPSYSRRTSLLRQSGGSTDAAEFIYCKRNNKPELYNANKPVIGFNLLVSHLAGPGA